MKRFTKETGGVRVVLQINKPENKELYYSGQERARPEDQIMCVQELKLQLLAKSAIVPGLITIIWSLITSNSTGMPDVEECSEELIEYVNNANKSTLNYQSGGPNNAA